MSFATPTASSKGFSSHDPISKSALMCMSMFALRRVGAAGFLRIDRRRDESGVEVLSSGDHADVEALRCLEWIGHVRERRCVLAQQLDRREAADRATFAGEVGLVAVASIDCELAERGRRHRHTAPSN